MAGKKQFPNGTWQYTFKKKGVLERPLYMTFDTEVEGDDYAARLEALLDRGIVPAEHQRIDRVLTIGELVREYERDAHPSPKDVGALTTVVKSLGRTGLSEINAAWVDAWISSMKRVSAANPGTEPAVAPAGDPIGVLADVFSRADKRAGILAEYADAARIAGAGCERDYDALTGSQNGARERTTSSGWGAYRLDPTA